MKKLILVFFVLVNFFVINACDARDEKYNIYTTVYPLKYVAQEILKDTEYTVGIVPGVVSHDSSTDWSLKEIMAMTEAKYIFYVGAKYDQYIDNEIDGVFKDSDVELVKLESETEYIEFIPGAIHDHDHEEEGTVHTEEETALGVDPHFWISPLKVLEASKLIYDKLLVAYPDDEAKITSNYTDLKARLSSLSNDFQDAISSFQKPLMTSTNLYGYLSHDYGLEYLPISPGYHEENDQISLNTAEIVEEAVFHDIRYIVYEKYITSPFSDAVFAELKLKDMNPVKGEFHILQALTDNEIKEGKNYITIMYENLEVLRAAGEYTSE